MGLFIAGMAAGIMSCVVVMLVRCAAWYEVKHPEDDYWHRNIWKAESGMKEKVQGEFGTEAENEERN